jgi:hypothetical protein
MISLAALLAAAAAVAQVRTTAGCELIDEAHRPQSLTFERSGAGKAV